jgi:hypothetical protein
VPNKHEASMIGEAARLPEKQAPPASAKEPGIPWRSDPILMSLRLQKAQTHQDRESGGVFAEPLASGEKTRGEKRR